MSNMLSTIVPKSDQLNADSLIGGPRTIKITKIGVATGEQPVVLNYEGDEGRPYKPCKSMRRVLVHIWGSDGNAYVGRSLTLYCDVKVTFGGAAVGGIRISHMSDIKEPVTMSLTASKAIRKPFTVKPLAVDAPQADMTPSEITEAGYAAAALGTAAYNTWCNARTAADKVHIKPLHAEWKRLATEIDTAKVA